MDGIITMFYPNKGGRPNLTEKQKQEKRELVLIKLEPYLKSGLSVNKALKETKIANSEFYRMMHESRGFWERIERFKQYISVLVNSVLVKHLHYIVQKQSRRESLTQEDVSFLKWFALNGNITKEEFGNRTAVSLFDPEVELQKMKDMVDSELSMKLFLNE